MRTPRVFHAEVVGPGTSVVLSRDESRHVLRVLRLAAGDEVSVFDGKGSEWSGTILETGGDRAEIGIGPAVEGAVDPALPVILYQSIFRHERMEWAIQKLTEVGVERVVPVRTARTTYRDPSTRRIERWRRIALEACKQSGRRTIPCIEEVGTIPGSPGGGEQGILLDRAPGIPALGAVLSGPRPSRVLLLVGSEGGLTDEEVHEYRASGWVAAHLGPRVLRAETAAVTAAALVLHAWGDLGGPGPVDTAAAGT